MDGFPHFLDQVTVETQELGQVGRGLFFIRVQGGLTPAWEEPPEPIVCCKVGEPGSGDYYEVDLTNPDHRGVIQHSHPSYHVLVLPYPPRHH